MKLYGFTRDYKTLFNTVDGVPVLTTQYAAAQFVSIQKKCHIAEVEATFKIITPPRRAKSARKEETHMAAKPKAKKVAAKAAPKVAKKVNGKKGKC